MLGRVCSCGAPNPYPRSRACPACSRAASARYRARHCEQDKKRYLATRALRTCAEQAARSARAYLAVYVRRGKVAKRPCAACGASDALPVQPWPAQPLLHLWACRKHRSAIEMDLVAGDRDPDGDPRTVTYAPRNAPPPMPARPQATNPLPPREEVPRPDDALLERVDAELAAFDVRLAEILARVDPTRRT